jgi:transposase
LDQDTTYVAFDTSKETMAVAIAESGRRREVRFFGTIANRPEAVRKLVEKLSKQHARLAFCYEAGPTGYGLYRQLRAMGHDCQVVAPSMVPVRPGGHIKTDRRDATTLAALFRAGELTAIWVPDAAHEAMRDLSRGRQAAMEGLRRTRQQLLSFLLRHGRIYPTRSHWTRAHRRWLSEQRFDHAAQQIVFEELIQAVEQTQSRRDRLAQQMVALLSSWSLREVVAALQALRGVALLSAITLMAEIGDFRRFANPRELMAWLGLVPREHSSGATTARGAITKAGNRRARRTLVEGAWTYRLPARIGLDLLRRNQALPEAIKDMAWKAQVRLCARYRHLIRAGKPTNVVTVAIARELAAFVWAIATSVMPPLEPTA